MVGSRKRDRDLNPPGAEAAARPLRDGRSVAYNGSDRLDLRVNQGLAIGSAQEPVGFVIVADSPLLGVPGERSPELQREVGEDAARGRNVAFLDVGHRFAARLDRCQEVEHVATDGRGDVSLQVYLGLVFGILLQLVDDILMDRPSTAERDEVVAVDAQLRGAEPGSRGVSPTTSPGVCWFCPASG